jgi:outer membrane protein assembly factor BamB
MISANMGRNVTRFSVLLVLLTLLTACGSPSNVEAPAKLKPIKKQYRVDVDWKKDVGPMASFGGRMRAAVYKGSVFVIDDEGRIVSLNAESGKQNWTSNTGKSVSTGITAADSILVFATRDGKVIAVSATDGSRLWSANVLGAVLSDPAIGNGKVYVQTEDGRVLALSEKDGSTAWTLERTVPSLSLHGNSGVVFKQGLLVVGFANGHVVGIDSRNGRTIWDRVVSYPKGRSDVERISDVDAPPLIIGYNLYAASYQGKLMAMDLRNGRVLWTRPLSAYLPFSGDDRYLYVVNEEGVILAIDENSGANAWAQNDLKRRISAMPLVLNGKIIVGDKEGYIHILDSGNGSITGRYFVDGSRILSQVIASGRVYALTEKGQLVSYTIKPV